MQQSPLAVNDEKNCALQNWKVISQNRGVSNFLLYLILSSSAQKGILWIIITTDIVVKDYFLPDIRSSEEQSVFT
jgi:hypothetical protein